VTDDPDKLQDVLQRIKQWCEAYPTNVFKPMTSDEVAACVKLLREEGYRTDALYAEWGRHILAAIHLMILELEE
jgi:ribosomal protein S8